MRILHRPFRDKAYLDARPRGCCRDFPETCTRARATSGCLPRLLRSLRQGRNLPLEEPRALVLFADGALGTGEAYRGKRAIARRPARPDIYRAALKPLGVALPVANAKVEGASAGAHTRGLSPGASLVLGPDGFFDGGLFDPDQLDMAISPARKR